MVRNHHYALRRMTPDDVPLALQLSSHAGWNQLEADWRRVLDYQPDGCFVAVTNDSLVGTVSSTCYGDELAWIGMMLVDESHRRQGIGERLMRNVMEFLDHRGVAEIKLDATPLGEPLYRRLGFEVEWRFHRWRRGETSGQPDQPAREGKLEVHHQQLDVEAFGVDRTSWLQHLARDSELVTAPNAFGMLRGGRIADYLGPIAAVNSDASRQIAETLLRRTRRPVFWDIPGPNELAAKMASALGFEPVRDLARMRVGRRRGQPQWDKLYALAGPAVG